MQIFAGKAGVLGNMSMCTHTLTHTHKPSLHTLLTGNTGWLTTATCPSLFVYCLFTSMFEECAVCVCISVSEVHTCMICALFCEVLRVTMMSVDQSVWEVAVKMMMWMMRLVIKDEEEMEDFRILRWLTFAG